MRVLVTGGAGFIGSHVVAALAERGDEVVVVDDLSTGKRENLASDVALVVHDVREPLGEVVRRHRPETIVHLAAQADVRVSVERPDFDAAVNVVGTVNVLAAARECGARVVFASTGGAIYGECERPAREDDPRLPLAPYGTAKLAGEEYLAVFGRLTGARHVSLRFGNVYGPRQDPHGEAGVVAIFLGRLRAGEQCLVFGDGLQVRDYVYVGDVTRAVELAVDGDAAGVFNVGTGTSTSVLDLYEACRTAVGVDTPAVHAPEREGEIQRSILDPALAERALGFRAEVGLGDGIARTWDWLTST